MQRMRRKRYAAERKVSSNGMGMLRYSLFMLICWADENQ